MFHLGLTGGFKPGLQRSVTSGFPSASQRSREEPSPGRVLFLLPPAACCGLRASPGDAEERPGAAQGFLFFFEPSREQRTSPLQLSSDF